MKGPLDIHQHLLAHDVHHEIVRLPRSAHCASSLAEALGLPPRRCISVHPFHSSTRAGEVLVVVLAPSDTCIDDAEMSRGLAELLRPQLGSAISFARAGSDFVSSHTDYLAGHVSPLLLPPDVIVIATQALVDLAASVVYTATGDAGTALGLRALDLLVLTRATVLPEGQATRRRPVRIDLDPAHVGISLDDSDFVTGPTGPTGHASRGARMRALHGAGSREAAPVQHPVRAESSTSRSEEHELVPVSPRSGVPATAAS
jgi:Cys-tRNA(Pro)/Cys-tRNA(Cys) deacylase